MRCLDTHIERVPFLPGAGRTAGSGY